jgi:hypothetical protein
MKILILFVCLLGFFTIAQAESSITLDDLIRNHAKAMGGEDAIEHVKSLQYKLQIIEPTFTVDGVYRADRDLHMRIDIYNKGKWVYAEGFDGKNGWESDKENGPANDATAIAAPALWHGILMPDKLFGLHESESVGSKVLLEGREKLDGVNYYVTKLTLKDGFSIYYYVNPDTWRIERSRDFTALHPDVDPSKKSFETRYSDFRMQDGVLRSFRSEKYDLKSGDKVQTTVIQSIETNPKLDPKMFEKM